MDGLWEEREREIREEEERERYGCSTVVLVCFTCPATAVVTVMLRAPDRVRERALLQDEARAG